MYEATMKQEGRLCNWRIYLGTGCIHYSYFPIPIGKKRLEWRTPNLYIRVGASFPADEVFYFIIYRYINTACMLLLVRLVCSVYNYVNHLVCVFSVHTNMYTL